MVRTILILCLCAICNSSWAFPPSGNDQKPPLRTIIIDPGHGGMDGGASSFGDKEAIIALEIGLRLRDLMKKEIPDLNILMTREEDVLPGNLSNKNAALRWRADYANRSAGDLFISIHLNASPQNQKYGKRQVGTKQERYYVYTGKGKSRKKIAKTRTVPVYERYRLEPSVYGTQTYILASDWYNQKIKSVGSAVKIYSDTEPGDSASLSDAGEIEMDPVEARIRATQYTRYFFQKSLSLATYLEEEFARTGRKSWGVLQRDWEGIHVLQATQMPSILVETGFIDHPTDNDYLSTADGQEEVARSIVNAVKRYKQVLENPSRVPPNTIVENKNGN